MPHLFSGCVCLHILVCAKLEQWLDESWQELKMVRKMGCQASFDDQDFTLHSCFNAFLCHLLCETSCFLSVHPAHTALSAKEPITADSSQRRFTTVWFRNGLADFAQPDLPIWFLKSFTFQQLSLLQPSLPRLISFVVALNFKSSLNWAKAVAVKVAVEWTGPSQLDWRCGLQTLCCQQR